jgi:hypothetical protein
MESRKYTCNRCAAEIAKDRTHLDVMCGPFTKVLIDVDLCLKCGEDLHVWLTERNTHIVSDNLITKT